MVAKNENISQSDKLAMYGNYKQATVGDATEKHKKSGIKGNMMYKSWSSLKGTSKEEAMKNYSEKYKELKMARGL